MGRNNSGLVHHSKMWPALFSDTFDECTVLVTSVNIRYFAFSRLMES